MRMPSAVSKEWVCMCKLCKLYPGRECDTGTDNWPRRVMAPKMGANGEEEKNETEKRRFRSASTCTPPRKRSISPQGVQNTPSVQERGSRRMQVKVEGFLA